MKIILTIKSILNYLYNNLIDLVWTKKVKFADGTELTTANIGSDNLYDIKTLAQAIADKNWCCISKKKILTLSKNPTIYNDILSKYDNCDMGNSSNMTGVNNGLYNSGHNYVEIKDNYAYTIKFKNGVNTQDGISVVKCNINDLSNAGNWSFVVDVPKTHNGNNFAEFVACYFGDNVILVRVEYHNENNDCIYVYDYNGNLIKILEVNHIRDWATFGVFSKLDNYIYFTHIVTGKIHGIDLCKIQDLADNSIEVETLVNIPFDIKNIKYAFGKYWFGFNVDGYANRLYCATDLADYSTYQEKVNEVGSGNFCVFDNDNWQTIICNGGNGKSKGSDDGGNTFFDVGFTVPNFSSISYQYFFQKATNDKCYAFITGKNSNNDDMLAITEVPFGKPNVYNAINTIFSFSADTITNLGFNNSCIIFNQNTDYYYFYISKKVYTDNYNINNTVVTISYYKDSVSQTKIVFGTSQNTDIDNVTAYLGYNPYFVLDTTTDSENVQLPINTNLWTYMFVGDNYIDNDVPSGNVTRLLEQAEQIIDSSSDITLDIKGNKEYKLTNSSLTSLTLNSYSDSPLGTTIEFKSGATATTITDSTSIDWVDGATPQPSANVKCLIFIWDNKGFYKEY